MDKIFQQPSVMSAQQHFSAVPSVSIPRSRFDRSHAVKTTFDAGYLIPIYLDQIVPGDSFSMNTTAFCRLATPLKPIMDNLYLDMHYWFVPNRLVFDKWVNFMGERPSPLFDPNTVQLPKLEWTPATGVDATQVSIGTYFGLPPKRLDSEHTESVSCLPFRCYKLIYNEWYRDQNLQTTIPFSNGDYDVITDQDIPPVRRGKRHDYFTSCLPWPQKGDPVVVPLGGSIPVYGRGLEMPVTPFVGREYILGDPNNPKLFGDGTNDGVPTYETESGDSWSDGSIVDAFIRLRDDVVVATGDLSDATFVTVNQLRTAFQIQALLERDARGGTRYIELILSHFGVKSDDARLQRPEYLGGGTQRVNINPVASTAAVPDAAPQANLAATGTVVGRSGFSKSFTEHGFIIGLASVRADLTYQKGIERFWSYETRYDFYWPTLAHLGEQAVLNREIFYSGQLDSEDIPIDEKVFGYQERYAELRYKPSLITGKFASDFASSLDVWHLSQDFATTPALNDVFIQENPPVARVIAVPAEPHFLCDIWHDLKCDRPMPVYSVPGLGTKF